MRPVVIVPLVFACLLAAPALTRPRNTAQTNLLDPTERRWFEDLSKAERTRELTALRAAQICVARYRTKNGSEDARVAAKLPEVHFLSGVSNGVVVYRTTPGIDDCSGPSISRLDESFVPLDEAWQGPPRSSVLQAKCSTLAYHYAADFNRTLAAARPEALRKACPTGKVAKPERTGQQF